MSARLENTTGSPARNRASAQGNVRDDTVLGTGAKPGAAHEWVDWNCPVRGSKLDNVQRSTPSVATICRSASSMASSMRPIGDAMNRDETYESSRSKRNESASAPEAREEDEAGRVSGMERIACMAAAPGRIGRTGPSGAIVQSTGHGLPQLPT